MNFQFSQNQTIETRTAILLFTRTAAQESAKKVFFHRQKRKNINIASRFIKYTKSEAEKTNLPFIISNGKEQIGDTFGERLANEVEKVFNKGFENVLVIGNDCLELTSSHLQLAKNQSENGCLVLGPDNKNGLYLLSINKSQYNKEAFVALKWESKQLMSSFQNYLKLQNITAFYLENLSDINDANQLKKVSFELSWQHILKSFLLSFFIPFAIINYTIEQTIKQDHTIGLSSLRAPPHPTL